MLKQGIIIDRMRNGEAISTKLARIFDYLKYLGPHGIGAPIPKEPAIFGRVQQGWCVACSDGETLCYLKPIGE